MNWPNAIKILLALSGFACTWLAAWNASRLSLDGVNAGPWDWIGMVAAPLVVTAGCVAVRSTIRAVASATSAAQFGARVPKWLVTGVGDRATARDPAGLRALADEVERLKKGGGL